jgi:hypothetical protein
MKASALAAKLMKHPNLVVKVVDNGSNSDQIAMPITAVEVSSVDVNGVPKSKEWAIEVNSTP